jgi:NAD(P)-dependent dehydrogenase (short-subunit alcohol dehydrogenase family)
MADYTASKYALQGWTDVLRCELQEAGVHVASVHPGEGCGVGWGV